MEARTLRKPQINTTTYVEDDLSDEDEYLCKWYTYMIRLKPGFHMVVSGAQPLKHQRTCS